MPSNADIDRDYYLGAVSGSSALMSNSDLERAYWLQMLGLSDPNLLTTTDLKYKFYLANATGGNASMSISDLERMYYLAQAGLSEPYSGSISDLRQTVPRGNINLLTPNQASGTHVLGTTVGFDTGGSGSSFTSSSVNAWYGLKSLRVVASAGGNGYHSTLVGTSGIPVVAGQTYTGLFKEIMDVGQASASGAAIIRWYNSVGGLVTTSTASSVTITSSAWVESKITAVAPPTAVYAALAASNQSFTAGQVYFTDGWGFWQGTSTTWAMPPGSPVWTPVNLLTSNQASGGETLSNVVGFGTYGTGGPKFYDTSKSVSGAGSLCTACTAGGVSGAVLEGSGTSLRWPVTAGKVYTFLAYFMGEVARDANLEINWFDAASASLGNVYPVVSINTTSWTRGIVTLIAPANAVTVRFCVRSSIASLANEKTWFDNIGLWEGAGGSWVMPPPVLNTAVWRVDAANTQADRLVDLSGNGRDAIFGAAAAAPVVLPYTGDKYIYIPNGVSSVVYTLATVPSGSTITMRTARIDTTGTAYPFTQTTAAGVIKIAWLPTGAVYVGWYNGTAMQDAAWPADTLSRLPYVWANITVFLATDGSGATLTVDGVNKGFVAFPTVRNVFPNVLTYFGYPPVAVTRVTLNDTHIMDVQNISADYTTVSNVGTTGGNFSILRTGTGFKAAVVDRPLLLFGGAQWADMQGDGLKNVNQQDNTVLLVMRAFAGTYNYNKALAQTVAVDGWAFHTSTISSWAANYIVANVQSAGVYTPVVGQVVMGGKVLGGNRYQYINGVALPSIFAVATTRVPASYNWVIGAEGSAVHGSPGTFEFVAAAIWDKVLTDDQIAEASAALVKYP